MSLVYYGYYIIYIYMNTHVVMRMQICTRICLYCVYIYIYIHLNTHVVMFTRGYSFLSGAAGGFGIQDSALLPALARSGLSGRHRGSLGVDGAGCGVSISFVEMVVASALNGHEEIGAPNNLSEINRGTRAMDLAGCQNDNIGVHNVHTSPEQTV